MCQNANIVFEGGDFEEAESSSVKIVTSPYVIDMSKTKKYFAPGSIFSILVCKPYLAAINYAQRSCVQLK